MKKPKPALVAGHRSGGTQRSDEASRMEKRDMAHEVETMAYANAVPWHGLGARVDSAVTVEEMLRAAGLDWSLRRLPMKAIAEDGSEIKVPGRFAHVRDSDNKVMVVSGAAWRPLQPADTLGFMREYVEAGKATLETAGSLRDGKMVWGLARLNHDFEVRPGDRVNGYLLISSPNEVGKAITVRTTTVRVVCANTMAYANRSGKGTTHFRQGHCTEFDVMAAKEAVGQAHEQLVKAEKNAKILDKLRLSVSDAVVKALVPVFFPDVSEAGPEAVAEFVKPENQPSKLQQLLASIEDGPGQKEIAGTGWAVMNGVTHWADHVYGNGQASRLHRAWMGDNSLRKLDVEQKLLELAV